MLLYPLFPFSGDAYRRTPRSPRPSSEYHVHQHSCLPSADGEQLKREKMSLWKEHQPWSPVKLELGETVKTCICARVCVHLRLCVCVCVRVQEGERKKVGGLGAILFWGLFLFEPMSLLLSLLAYACGALDWLWWECWLAAVWDIIC